jgi:hypothetical protein
VILAALAFSLVLFLGARSYISKRGERYFREVLEAYNRAQQGASTLELASYEGGWSGAEATVRLRISGSAATLFENPVLLKFRIDYGPLFPAELETGLIRVESRGAISSWLKASRREGFLRTVPGDLRYRYLGVMDWWHVMHEKIDLPKIEVSEEKRKVRWNLEALRIRSDYRLETLQGRAAFTGKRLTVEDRERKDSLVLREPRLGMEIREFDPRGPVFGALSLSAGEIRLHAAHPATSELRFSASAEGELRRRDAETADLRIGIALRTEEEKTREAWNGLKAVQATLRLESLGIEGIRKAMEMQRERRRLREEMALAVGRGDDVAMQKAILALQALDTDWIDAYNSLLIRGKSRVLFDAVLDGEKRSRIRLDLRFTGQKLPADDPFGAMVALTTGLDRIAEGSFDLTLERKQLRTLHPEAALVLDAMAEKGLAKLEGGIYRLKGELRDGKIVINGTRYAPQELIMMILI